MNRLLRRAFHGFGGMTILGISRKIISNKYNIIVLVLLIVFFMGVCVSETSAADSNTNSAVKPNKVSQSQVLSASKNLKTYIEKNKKLPNYIAIGNYKYSMEEYMSISSATIVYKNKKSKSNIVVKYGVKSPKSPTGNSISGKLTKKQYSTYASNVNKYINKYNVAPNYASTRLGKIKFQTFIYGNSKILAWSKDNKGVLPKTLTLKVSKTHSMNRYVPKFPKKHYKSSNSK
ncbi:pseudomurein-binding repeat-containing protein [Methanobrevibacter arboriphilus]|uniref:pseudomurein-binding repeat-containing protein n=1 Tax=Methanobrevibacter arboriphilus TaxID=39441 RepID=UPI000AF83A06|nr:pseudomurein-binding repeat-containing protein [Methanobrevibacter arboriphilus]